MRSGIRMRQGSVFKTHACQLLPGEKGGMNLSDVSAGPIAANSDPQGSKTGWAFF
jgi:hypothetical protein